MARRLVLVVLAGLALTGSVLAATGAFDSGGRTSHGAATAKAPALAASRTDSGSAAKFAYLSAQKTNSCGMSAEQMRSYSDSKHLQGSCCFPMDAQSYSAQVQGLRKYHEIGQIPSDPYDIGVGQAKRLLSYNAAIALDRTERATYKQSIKMAPEHGPCCCKCWRWQVFEGMSKYLIAKRRFGAPQVAKVIGLVDGCGGPHEQGSSA